MTGFSLSPPLSLDSPSPISPTKKKSAAEQSEEIREVFSGRSDAFKTTGKHTPLAPYPHPDDLAARKAWAESSGATAHLLHHPTEFCLCSGDKVG